MKKIIILFGISASLMSSQKQTYNHLLIQSPDKQIKIAIALVDSQAYYSIDYKNEPLLSESKLGFEFKNLPPFSKHLIITGYKISSTNETWNQVWGQTKTVINNYNQITIQLEEQISPNRKFNLIFKAYNDGLGFRYEIPSQKGLDSLLITDELTEFNLADNYWGWSIPADFDSDEMLYTHKPVSDIESANTPITLETKKGYCLSIHEANLTDYASMTLKKKIKQSNSLKCNLVPWSDGIKVKTKVPMVTPWRTIQIAASPGGLIESNLILNLNEPNKLADVSWIKPMKFVGIWWGMHLGINTWTVGERHAATTENMKKYIDFASTHSIPAVLAEGWNTGWEKWGQTNAFDFVTPYSDYNLKEINKYAKSKNISIISHHETGGDIENYEKKLDTALALLQSLHIHTLKTGYAGGISKGQNHYGQYMVNHYQKVVETAATYKISIDVHEPIKPTGIQRTYPNLMSGEGARGMEWNAWSVGNPPEHHTILPFTRILGGPMDYTPGIFDVLYKNAGKRIKWNDQDKGNSRVNTTIAAQLALFVVLYSPLQMASDLIENYKGQKAFKFIEDVPVNWEFTKVLNAKIGDYVTIVRKDINSNDWFLGSITDENSRTLEVNLSFLTKDKKYIAELYLDGADSDWKTNPYSILLATKEVTNTTILQLKLAAGGGEAIRFHAIN